MNTAQTAYTARRAAIDAKLEALRVALVAHDDLAAKQPANWGFVGNLGQVDSLIADAVAFLTPEV